MNRHERRANAKTADRQRDGSVGTPSPVPTKSNLALRVMARILLARWVLKRVHHPDLLAILLQVAHQVGRTDAIAALTVKLYPGTR